MFMHHHVKAPGSLPKDHQLSSQDGGQETETIISIMFVLQPHRKSVQLKHCHED